jgi:hypothetical protein
MSNNPASAATDVPALISDLDGGMFERMLSQALSEAAAAAVDHAKPGEVSIKIKIEQIPGTHQVRLQHDLKYVKPTSMGKSSEETTSATVLHVGRYGALSLAQPSLLERNSQQNELPGVSA